MSMIFWIFAKFLRTRKLFWIVGAIELVLFPGSSLVTSATSRRQAGS